MMRRFAMIVAMAMFCVAFAGPAPNAQTRLAQVAAVSNPTRPWQFEIKAAPIQVGATMLEVHDKTKTATFSGHVQVIQGDTTIRCHSLDVFYDPSKSIRRMEARGGVTVLTKDQSANGDIGIYDLKTKTVTLIGDVVIMPKASEQ